ncbi:MAG: TetR/AcrR family transcriptional regulator [Planctomycetota bacterium]
MKQAGETATQLLDVAQDLIQQRGYNAFSYKDLADAVGIKTASIHYHFPAKTDLGVALMRRYQAELEVALAKVDRAARTAKGKLKAFVQLYAQTESAGAICLCGSLAADRQTLAPELQEAVSDYLDRSVRWVAQVVAGGVRDGELTYAGKPAELAATLLSSLQGGLILGRARAGGAPLLATVQRVLFQTLGVR